REHQARLDHWPDDDGAGRGLIEEKDEIQAAVGQHAMPVGLRRASAEIAGPETGHMRAQGGSGRVFAKTNRTPGQAVTGLEQQLHAEDPRWVQAGSVAANAPRWSNTGIRFAVTSGSELGSALPLRTAATLTLAASPAPMSAAESPTIQACAGSSRCCSSF